MLREQRSIRDDIARAYATVCGVSPGYLLTGDGNAPTEKSVRTAIELARTSAPAKPTVRRPKAAHASRPGTKRTRAPDQKRAVGEG